jgi:hypothetical protein
MDYTLEHAHKAVTIESRKGYPRHWFGQRKMEYGVA